MGKWRRCSARTVLKQLFIAIIFMTLLMIFMFGILDDLIGFNKFDNDGELNDN
jgi:hypothetical protein